MKISISNIAWDVREDIQISTILNNLGIDSIDIAPSKYFSDINKTSEEEVAKALFRRIKSPGTVDMLELADNRLKLVGIKCESNCCVLGKTLRKLSEEFKDYLANILFVFRGDEKFIVNSNTKLEKDDLIYMVVDNNNFTEVTKEFGHHEVQAQKIVIIGGGNIGYSLSQAIDEKWDDGNLSTGTVQIWQGSNLGVIIHQGN